METTLERGLCKSLKRKRGAGWEEDGKRCQNCKDEIDVRCRRRETKGSPQGFGPTQLRNGGIAFTELGTLMNRLAVLV